MDGAGPQPERTHCLNCGTALGGPYCASCGQKRDIPAFTWHYLLAELPAGLFAVDKGVLYTVKELFTRPGLAIREYLEGKRVRHFRPLSLLVVSAGLYGFLGLFLDLELPGMKLKEDQMKIISLINQHYALLELVLLPCIAFGTWTFFRRSGQNFVEHLVINSFLGAQRIIVTLALLPLMFAFNGTSEVMGIASASNVISIGLFIWAMIQFFPQRPAVQVMFRSIGAYLLSYLLLGLLLALAIAAVAVARSKGASL